MSRDKTWKREVALAMFIHLVWVASIPNVMVLQILIVPYMVFMLAAFGLDAAVKQMGFSFNNVKSSK